MTSSEKISKSRVQDLAVPGKITTCYFKFSKSLGKFFPKIYIWKNFMLKFIIYEGKLALAKNLERTVIIMIGQRRNTAASEH